MDTQENTSNKQDSTPRSARSRAIPTPPRMTKAEWAKRTKTTVTLTREELEHLGQLIAAGHVLLRNSESVSPRLKTAMTRLGINTRGL